MKIIKLFIFEGAVIVLPGHPGNGTSIDMSTSSTSHQQQQQQQGIAFPESTPVYSQNQQDQSPSSQQQKYPSQPYQPQQQYSQAPIQPSGVTYEADHQQGQHQQLISQEEHKTQPGAPPPYFG